MEMVLWFIGLLLALVSIYFISTFVYMMFIAQVTELRVLLSSEYKILSTRLFVTEITENEFVIGNIPKAETKDSSQTRFLEGKNIVSKANNYFEESKAVQALSSVGDGKALIFLGNEVFYSTDTELGVRFIEFSEPKLKEISHVAPVSDKLWLITGTPTTSEYPEHFLYSIELGSRKLTKISDHIYSNNSKAYTTVTFLPPGFEGAVVVYYVGNWQYSFSGATRPKHSIVRIYSREFSEGFDIIKFSLKSGIIIDVRFDGECLVLTGDPGRPVLENKQRLPRRYWKVSFK